MFSEASPCGCLLTASCVNGYWTAIGQIQVRPRASLMNTPLSCAIKESRSGWLSCRGPGWEGEVSSKSKSPSFRRQRQRARFLSSTASSTWKKPPLPFGFLKRLRPTQNFNKRVLDQRGWNISARR